MTVQTAAFIRPAGPDDAGALWEIQHESLTGPWSRESVAAHLALATCRAWRTRDGFILLSVVKTTAEIQILAVRRAARRRGLGRALLAHAVHQLAAEGVCELYLDVAADNDAALSLYRNAGFAVQGRRRGYYARPQNPAADALVMGRRIR